MNARYRWTLRLLVAVIAAAVGAPIARADEESTPAEDGPWVVGTAAGGGVIVDDYLKDATPDEAADDLQWCSVVPGCVAVWQEGLGTTVILERVAAEGSGIDPSDALGNF
jgi:hypothetical protein